MGRRSRRRRRQRAAKARARARALAARRKSSIVKKKTPTRTRRTIARLRTPITRKAPITRRTTSTRTRKKITSTARKTRSRYKKRTTVPTAAQRKRARTRRTRPVVRTTVPTAAQRKRARSRATTVRRRVINKVTRVKRNKRDKGFTKVTRIPTRFRPTNPVSKRVGRVPTSGLQPRGVQDAQREYLASIGRGRRTLDVQRDQSPTTFFDRRRGGGSPFNLRDRELVLAGNADRDGVLGGGNIPGGTAPPRPTPISIPPAVPSNPKDVLVSAQTFLNGKRISGALIRENGNTDGTRSPASRRYNIKQLLGNGKTFTAELNGATSDQHYTLRAVIKNETITTQVPVPPDDFVNPSFLQGGLTPFDQGRFSIGPGNEFGNIQRQAYNMRRQAQQARLKPRFKTITRTQEKVLIEWKYYKGGKLLSSSSIVPGQNYTATFAFTGVKVPDDNIKDTPDDDFTPTDPNIPNPKPRPKPELLILHESNDNVSGLYAASVNGNNVSRIGSDTFKSKDAFQITLQAKQPSRYTISKFKVLRGSINADATARGFQDYDVQELNITVDQPTTIIISFKKVVPILVPSVSLSSRSFKYNIANPTQITLAYDSDNADNVQFRLNKTTLNSTDEAGSFTISNSMFNSGVGQYTGYVVPSNSGYGQGTPKRFSINVVNEVVVQTPDIVNINYPETLRGADFKGFDVDFDVSYQSVNTNFVKIYLNDTSIPYGKFSPNQSVGFNVLKVARKLGAKVDQDEDNLTFKILLQPHNTSTSKEVKGKIETLTINFLSSNISLPRGTTIDKLCSAFEFKTNLFDDETSKYLTHLAHFGDGKNKLIANWENDDVTFRKFKFDELRQKFLPEYAKGGFNSLVLKMYEPLGKEIQPNQELFISKIITQPIIDEISIVDDSEEYCVPLKGPNFGVNECGSPADTGFELIDELVGSGSQSSAKLIDTFVSSSGIDTKKLDIQYVSSSFDFIETEYGYSVDGTVREEYRFDNFVHFGSAEEKARNYFYKVSLLETYKNGIATIESSSGDATTSLSLLREKESLQKKINDVKANFDGFEHFLTDSTSSLAFPKESDGISLQSTGSGDSIAWYNTLLVSSSDYDRNNVDYLANNIPQYIQNDDEQTDFILFLDMIGSHFDILWSYVRALKRNTKIEEQQRVGISDDMLRHILKNYSWIPHSSQSTKRLWEYVLGYRDSKQTSKLVKSGKEYESTIWRRILNNLPYLLKHKGTRRGLSAVLTTYGIPSSLLTIMEFGGPRQEESQSTTFTFDDRTSALVFPNATDDAKLLVDWKLENGVSSSHAVEMRFKTDQLQSQSLIENEPHWNIQLEHQRGNIGILKFSSSFGELETESGSLFNNEFTQLVVNVNHHSGGEAGASESIEIVALQDFQSRIRMALSSSTEFTESINTFFSGSQLTIGGGFTGSIDEFRIWSSSLSASVIEDHALFPEKINGNHISSSTEDLMLRLDFEKPKNLNTNPVIPNVAPDTGSNGTIRYASSATASLFDDNQTYPYHYEVYDRQVTAKVPSMGFGPADKFRFESASLVQNLSYRQRATKKAFDTAPLDSNQLGIFLSPTKELNMDIIKSLPDFVIDDFIGDPSHQYMDDYPDLLNLRKYVFGRYNLNIYEYINIIKYIDKSLFETIKQMIPARVKVMDGLLIEPHFLERNKERRKAPEAEVMESKEGVHDVSRGSDIHITSSVEHKEANLDLENLISIEETLPQFNTAISGGLLNEPQVEYNDFNATILDTKDTTVSSSRLDYETIINDGAISQSLISELEFNNSTIVGLDPDGLAKNGFGLGPATNGFILRTTRDGNNYKKEKLRVWIVKKEKKFKQKIQLNPLDSSLGTIVSESVVRSKTIVTFTSPSGSLANSVGTVDNDGTVVQVTPLDGYLPTHNRFTSDLTTGMENSYFKGCKQTQATTLDGTPPVEVFTTNPNTIKVSDSGRGSGEPIIEIE